MVPSLSLTRLTISSTRIDLSSAWSGLLMRKIPQETAFAVAVLSGFRIREDMRRSRVMLVISSP